MTECNQEMFAFTVHFSRRVEAGFSTGQVSTDGGALLLREVDRKINLLGRLAGRFSDGRSPLLVKHQLPEMLGQRIYGLALGYEDLNDHEWLRVSNSVDGRTFIAQAAVILHINEWQFNFNQEHTGHPLRGELTSLRHSQSALEA
jgi:hypothetical protein